LPSSTAVARRGPGRPPGSRNLSTLTAAKYYMAEHGDPLRRGVHIAALPILASGVLEGLAARLGCTCVDDAKWWSGVYSATLPFIRQRLGQLEVKPIGAPGAGNPVAWSFSEGGEIVDMLPELVCNSGAILPRSGQNFRDFRGADRPPNVTQRIVIFS
jgi:hypothetical protein